MDELIFHSECWRRAANKMIEHSKSIEDDDSLKRMVIAGAALCQTVSASYEEIHKETAMTSDKTIFVSEAIRERLLLRGCFADCQSAQVCRYSPCACMEDAAEAALTAFVQWDGEPIGD